MYKNYFILNRIVLELNSLLNRSTIVEVFSQEKDKLILKCVNEKQLFLEISVNPGEPYLTLKNEYHRAKKNSVDVFEDFLPLDSGAETSCSFPNVLLIPVGFLLCCYPVVPAPGIDDQCTRTVF